MINLSANRSRILLSKLINPPKVMNYLGIRAAALLKPAYVPFMPSRIDIEPNNTCNLKCRHCQVTHWSKQTASLDALSFRKILDQFPHLTSAKLQGMGEPLLNGQLVQMLGEGERRGISMFFSSNGTVFTEDLGEQLALLKNTHICFSIDGATAETFEKIRMGSSFERVTKNVERLLQLRGARRDPVISAWTVVNSHNVRELPEIVRLAGNLGLDFITLQTSLTNWGQKEMTRHTDSTRVPVRSGELISALEGARHVARTDRIDLKIHSGDSYSRKKKCPWPWTSAFIAANGDVVPCCILANSDVVKMGNVLENDFSIIWNSEEYQDFRKRIRNHDLPEFCRNCYGG